MINVDNFWLHFKNIITSWEETLFTEGVLPGQKEESLED